MRGKFHPGRVGLVGEAEAGQRRHDDVKGVLGLAAVGRRVLERTDQLQELEDGARPAMGENDRQGITVLRAHMQKVDPEAVDPGAELRECVQITLHSARRPRRWNCPELGMAVRLGGQCAASLQPVGRKPRKALLTNDVQNSRPVIVKVYVRPMPSVH